MSHTAYVPQLRVKLVHPEARLPTRAFPTDAGLDLYAVERQTLFHSQVNLIDTGIALELPEGYVGLILDRSSMASRGTTVRGGVIDCSYRGTVKVCLVAGTYPAQGKEAVYEVLPGDRIAQLVLVPIVTPMVVDSYDELTTTPRGESGFGSTGV